MVACIVKTMTKKVINFWGKNKVHLRTEMLTIYAYGRHGHGVGVFVLSSRLNEATVILKWLLVILVNE